MRNSKKPPQKFILKDESGKTLEIPLEGSLGILASGYKGITLEILTLHWTFYPKANTGWM